MTPIEKLALPEKTVIDRHLPTGYVIRGHSDEAMHAYADTCMAPLLARIGELEAEKAKRTELEEITAEELQLFDQTIEEFCDCGETSTPYETLMKWANRGWLECEHFVSTAEGNRVLESIEPPLFAALSATKEKTK